MSVIRTKKQENPFVQIDKVFLSNEKMSFKAKGILAYILSKPDGWTIRMTDLVKRSSEGKAAVASGIDELMLHGYIFKYQERAEGGKFGDWVYEVYERPEFNTKRDLGENIIKMRLKEREEKRENKKETTETRKPENGYSPKPDFPESDKPESDKPESDNRVYSNNDFSNNDFSNNDYNNNHHQQEGLTEKQMNMINEFAKSKNIKEDDELYIKLINVSKEYKPNSMDYIDKIYQTIITEKEKPTYEQTKKEKHSNDDVVPGWYARGDHKRKAPTQKKSAQPMTEEQKRIEELRQKFLAENV